MDLLRLRRQARGRRREPQLGPGLPDHQHQEQRRDPRHGRREGRAAERRLRRPRGRAGKRLQDGRRGLGRCRHQAGLRLGGRRRVVRLQPHDARHHAQERRLRRSHHRGALRQAPDDEVLRRRRDLALPHLQVGSGERPGGDPRQHHGRGCLGRLRLRQPRKRRGLGLGLGEQQRLGSGVQGDEHPDQQRHQRRRPGRCGRRANRCELRCAHPGELLRLQRRLGAARERCARLGGKHRERRPERLVELRQREPHRQPQGPGLLRAHRDRRLRQAQDRGLPRQERPVRHQVPAAGLDGDGADDEPHRRYRPGFEPAPGLELLPLPLGDQDPRGRHRLDASCPVGHRLQPAHHQDQRRRQRDERRQGRSRRARHRRARGRDAHPRGVLFGRRSDRLLRIGEQHRLGELQPRLPACLPAHRRPRGGSRQDLRAPDGGWRIREAQAHGLLLQPHPP
ncbi:hypothetical protein D3C86_1315750 [compost metagenome]